MNEQNRPTSVAICKPGHPNFSEKKNVNEIIIYSDQKETDLIYHGNCPGPASSPPIIRELIEMPQCVGLMRCALFAGIDDTVGNTMAV